MMRIGSANGMSGIQAGAFGTGRQTDPVSRNIQEQIAKAQKQLQELSSNEALSPEEKMKKRQEIQQEITNLNQQLRQHQIELRKERQSRDTSMDDMLGGKKNAGPAKSGRKENGLSQASMEAMISADSSMKQAQVQGSVAVRMEGRAGVLKSEIKTDKASGANTEKKEAELAKTEQKAAEAAASQGNTLAGAGKAIARAAEEEQDGRTDKADAKGKDGKAGKTVQNGQKPEQPRQTQE